MIDPKILRTNPDAVRRSQAARGESVELVDELVAADERRRSLMASSETARAEQKAKQRVADGAVCVDGEIENRKRAKLRPGQRIDFAGETIELVAAG